MNTQLQEPEYIIDIETGEILGIKEEFHVTDESSADWVLEKIMDAEANIARENMKLKAITENIESRKKEYQNKINFLKMRFGPELEQFAREQVEGGKSKTWKGSFGRLSFRSVKGGLRVVDKEEALTVAQVNGFTNAIKTTEEFQISKLTDAQREMLEFKLPGGFELKPDSEVFEIKSGVN